MGYQLPGLGNVTFRGFSALGKQQTRDTTHAKGDKDQESQSHRASSSASPSPSSPLSSLYLAAGRPSCEGRLLERGFLQKWRQKLRPLLNSLRFVEASNRESSRDGACCIGPFQISRQYHQDAWKPSPPIAWSRCRDLNHAENTVVAYWLKYCPEAVERHDFETLAKMHKGAFFCNFSWSQNRPFTFAYVITPHALQSCGPQGLQKEETNCYWSKVSQHLKLEETAGSKKENTAWTFFSHEKRAKQEGTSKVHQKHLPALSPINTNTTSSSKAQRPHNPKISPSCVTRPKQQLPLIQTLKPKMFRRVLPAQDKKSAVNFLTGGVKPGSTKSLQNTDCSSANKRLRQTSYIHVNTRLEPVSLGHVFNMGYCHLARADRIEKAVVIVQAIWRMRRERGAYERMRSAAVLIQRRWRSCHFVLLHKQRIQSREAQDLNSATNPWLEATPTSAEKQECYARPIGSPCELLYRSDISQNQEDELLTELVSLLSYNTLSPSVESCHSFRFPHSFEEANEACTPKMKPELRHHFVDSPNLSAKRKAEESSCIALSSVENTPLMIKQALLSPLMEKEIIAELAKLFPSKAKSHEDVPSASHSLVSHEGLSIDSSKPIENEATLLHEQCGKDGIIRRLTFQSSRDEKNRGNNENACVVEPCIFQSSLLSSSEDILETGSSCFSSKAEGDEEELKGIDIPLLVDQSPVLTSKRRVRNQNPCNRKVEKALVSSLSEWQCSDSFEEESQNEGFEVDLGADARSSHCCRALTASKEFFWCSLTKSSSTTFLKQARLMDKSTEADHCTPSQISDNLHSDFMLETPDMKHSTVYAKAVFRCLNFSLDEYEDRGSFCQNSHRKRDSSGYLATMTHTRLAALQHLCMLWDRYNVDLLTRSLKFRGLQAAHGECQQGHLSLQSADEVLDIQSEIDNLESLPQKLKEESKKRELVLHQRDVIYTNIAAYCNIQERQYLYDKWEIQKLLTGRLKKIVYELLWIDPQRYQESTELVIRYL